MTREQSNKIEILFDEFKERCKSYSGFGDDDDCSFEIYQNDKNPLDKNIVIRSSFVSGLSDNFEPFHEILNLIVQENGDTVNLSAVLNANQRMEYLNSLTKIYL
jgi:hypothetical protein